MSDIKSQVAKSSLGTKSSVAARRTVSTTRAAAIKRRSAEIRAARNPPPEKLRGS
ncbi:hypothetical protein [Mycobacterium terramassiliense]|jgi:hypothetical protein|uniref:hypothetical protein n=1 Tax=Mycobacterium terramassiliense TaxID=1841859 RepID=UPI0012FF76AD|nr:hypothetical protein [Mycobacterium terramassiliense]